MHILSHNGTVTVQSPSGEHRTFQIKTQPDDATFAPGQRILSVLTGPNNETDFTSFAFVHRSVRLWKAKREKPYVDYARLLLHPQHYEALGFRYLWSGTCRRCNRKLTTPGSIESGIGPVCATH